MFRDFGDNIIAALPDVIGQTIGSVAANAATSPTARVANDATENAALQDGFAAATTSAQLSGLVVSVANLSLPSALRLVQFIDQPEESLFARGVAAITDVTGAIADRARVLADTLIGVVRDPEAALDEIVVTARRSATSLLDRGGSYLNSLRDISITNAINTINGFGGVSREGVRFGSAERGTVITTRGVSIGGAQGGLVVTNQGASLGALIATRAGVSLNGAEGLVIARNGVRALGVDLIRTGPGPIATGSIGTVASIGTIPGLIPTQVVPAANGGVRGVGGGLTENIASVIRAYPDGSLRTPNGRFASVSGVPAPGTSAASRFADFLISNGVNVVGRELEVNGPLGVRRYDIVTRNPNGTLFGLEVKSGGATRDRYQEFSDIYVNRFGAIGRGQIRGELLTGTATVYLPSGGQ